MSRQPAQIQAWRHATRDERQLRTIGRALAGEDVSEMMVMSAQNRGLELRAGFQLERETLRRYQSHLQNELTTVSARLAEIDVILGPDAQ